MTSSLDDYPPPPRKVGEAGASAGPRHELAVELRWRGMLAHVAVRGEIDLKTVPELFGALEGFALEAAELIVLDLSNVPFMDSSGISALITLYRALGERLRILPGERLEPLLEKTGARHFLPFTDPEDRAGTALALAGGSSAAA